MGTGRGRAAWPIVLMAAFAVNLGLTVSLTGRLQGAAFATAQASDAPAGSIVVFWIAGGWAATAAVVAAVLAWRSDGRTRAATAVAAGLLAFAGVAGVVANWERPSSFSPLVRFPVQELTILAGGALFIGGAYMLLRAARASRIEGALVCATGAAAAAGLIWTALSGIGGGLASLAERPVDVALAALAWGAVCLALPRVLDDRGPARTAATIAVAPVLLTMLIWLEQAVGVAGPQPFIVSGVLAGAVTVTAGAVALWYGQGRAEPADALPRGAAIAALAPLLMATVALGLPAIVATAVVSGSAGDFSGSWTLSGWESLAGVTGFALAALLAALVTSRAPLVPAVAGLAACAAWPFTLSTPMHVLTGWLPPGLEQYYGTEYASIEFSGVTTLVSTASVLLCAAGLLALIVSDSMRRLRSSRRSVSGR